MFIPFAGAWITLKEQPVDAEAEAYIALGGPVAGTIAAVLVYFWSRSTDSSLLLAVAYSGLFLNLFNLLPVSPLDGGRITGVISPRIWLLGAPVLVALFFYRPSPVLLMIGILSIPQLLHAWSYNPNAPENQRYWAVPAKTKFEYAAAYLFLTFFLALMTFDVHEMLEHTRNLHR
jgi:Zn-dependent protease